MSTRSKFVVMEHKAKRAGLHFDIRFRMLNSSKWASFACRKEPPTSPGQKIMAIRTHNHTEEEALFIGKIESGYGAGTLKKWDNGSCEILIYHPGKHIVVTFKGRKLKGTYHFISSNVTRGSFKVKGETYMLFKSEKEFQPK